MMPTRQGQIREILRERIASGLHRGALAPGQRLPSTRRLGSEFRVAPRTVMAAYAELAVAGMVELRRRSGIYVAHSPTPDPGPSPTAGWLVDLMLQSFRHGIPPRQAPRRLASLLDPRGLRAVCIAGNRDQADHMCRELRADYGLHAEPVLADRLTDELGLPAQLRRATMLVATALVGIPAQTAARRLGKPLIVVRLRADVMNEMVLRLRAGPVYFVGSDPRFADALRVIFEPTGHGSNLRPIILGQDDPGAVPEGAPAYILELAYERLGDTPLTRRVKPLPRVFSDDTARQILCCVLQANLARPGLPSR